MVLTDEEIIARYGAGESQQEIARIDGRFQASIRRILLRNGVNFRDARQEKARGGRKTQVTWGKTPEARLTRSRNGRAIVESGLLASVAVKGGRIQGRKNIESGHIVSLGRIYGRIYGRKNVESGLLVSVAAKGGRISGRKNVENGLLARIAKGVPSTADGILFRSQTEVSLYCVAQELGGEPVYEPWVISLPDGRSYTPDFVFGRSILDIPANVPIELKPTRAAFCKSNLPKAIEAGAFVVYWDELIE